MAHLSTGQFEFRNLQAARIYALVENLSDANKAQQTLMINKHAVPRQAMRLALKGVAKAGGAHARFLWSLLVAPRCALVSGRTKLRCAHICNEGPLLATECGRIATIASP